MTSAALGELRPEGVEVGLITESERALSWHEILRSRVSEDSHAPSRPELKDAAQAMGITYNTARTHLKRIYAKTNVNRLSALVHMIVTGPVGLLIHATE